MENNNNAKSYRLTDEDKEMLEVLRKHYGARNGTETVRRAIAQAFTLAKQVDEDGNLTIEGRDGNKYKIPSKW